MCRPSQAIGNCFTNTVTGQGSNGNFGSVAGVCFMETTEEISGSFDQVSSVAERCIARDRTESNQPFIRLTR